MVVGAFSVIIFFIPNMDLAMSVQQLIAGVSSTVLLSVPMFILAADIMCAGNTTKRLLDLVETFVGHIHGGMAITTAITCTMFGAISGSTQATVVAIGKPMRQRLLSLGIRTRLQRPYYKLRYYRPFDTAEHFDDYVRCCYGLVCSDLFIAGVGPVY